MMRLDLFLTEKQYFRSRSKSVDAIKKGIVFVNGKLSDKPSKEVAEDAVIEIRGKLEFVSKGGYKLDKALKEFNLDVKDKVFADVGASTGGFTDCLLSRSVKRVYAVDVGCGQLDKSLSENPSVVVMDDTNARYLKKESFPEPLDGISVDCSFISLKLLLPVFDELLDENGILLALIKPQFECGISALPKSGILKDAKLREDAVMKVLSDAQNYGFKVLGISEAPKFKDKNVEYVVLLKKSGENLDTERIKELIRQ